MKALTPEFLASVFKSTRNLIWIQDEYEPGATELVQDACKLMNINVREVLLSQTYALDLEDLFNKLPSEGGVIVFREVETAHEYMGMLMYSTLLYYEFRKSSLSKSVTIPSNWKFVMVTNPNFHLPDRALYRKFLKLVNQREPLLMR